MKPSYELWRLAVLVIAILSSMVCDVMNVAAVGTERTVMSSSIRSRGSNDLATSLGPGAVKAWSNLAKTRLTCSSRLSQNEISSFGVLNTRGSHSRRRGSRKLKILQARLQREEGISSNEIDNSQDRGPFTSASPFATAGAAGRLADAPGQDDPLRTSFWLRNKCHDGFVVVKEKTRVLAQHEGLDRHNEEVKLVKESCVAGDPRTSSLMTRLYSPSQDRYICFNQKGKVRAMKPKRAERMGKLCAFYERTIPDYLMTSAGGHEDVSAYINLQSAHHPDWFLGFGPNPTARRHRGKGRGGGRRPSLGLVHTREGHRAALPRRMPMTMTSGRRRPHQQHRRHQQQQRRRRRHRWLTVARSSREVRAQVEKRCDFLFATGRYVQRPQKTEQDWAGLFSALPDILEKTSKEETYKSESAVTATERTTTSTANKLEVTKTATSKTTSTTTTTTTTTTTSKTTNSKLLPSSSSARLSMPKVAASKTATTTKLPPPSPNTSSTTKFSPSHSKNTQQISTESETTARTTPTSAILSPVKTLKIKKKHPKRNIKLLIEKMRKNPKLAAAIRKRARIQKLKRLRRLRQPSFFYMHDQQVKVSRKAL